LWNYFQNHPVTLEQAHNKSDPLADTAIGRQWSDSTDNLFPDFLPIFVRLHFFQNSFPSKTISTETKEN
jgi:hypothetical protein